MIRGIGKNFGCLTGCTSFFSVHPEQDRKNQETEDDRMTQDCNQVTYQGNRQTNSSYNLILFDYKKIFRFVGISLCFDALRGNFCDAVCNHRGSHLKGNDSRNLRFAFSKIHKNHTAGRDGRLHGSGHHGI